MFVKGFKEDLFNYLKKLPLPLYLLAVNVPRRGPRLVVPEHHPRIGYREPPAAVLDAP